jgi:hypothetical protein
VLREGPSAGQAFGTPSCAVFAGKPPRTVDSIFNPRTNGSAPAMVLHFAEARRSLKLNKTQA